MFDEKLTAHLAELSKLEFTGDELTKMTKDMTDIITLMDKVCDFDPSSKPYTLDSVDYENLREDNYNNSYPNDKILKNAKNVKNNSFVVPKVV
jgi:aspartyl/glutamyl-tRNA(Asn/Gln) amidotransferase C subunit